MAEDTQPKTELVEHRDTEFEDDTVHLDGHAYVGCRFKRCTMIYRGGNGGFESCEMTRSVWIIDMAVYDEKTLSHLEAVLKTVRDSIRGIETPSKLAAPAKAKRRKK